ncbi:MAG TPA: hypothetical protein DE117_06705 [Fervidobacterium sp.]|nr:hypothetical protein [Fervidobacterium sp.]
MKEMFIEMFERNGKYCLRVCNSAAVVNLYIGEDGYYYPFRVYAKEYRFKWTARRAGKKHYKWIKKYGLTKEPYTEIVAP